MAAGKRICRVGSDARELVSGRSHSYVGVDDPNAMGNDELMSEGNAGKLLPGVATGQRSST